jgi:hypothetical protein
VDNGAMGFVQRIARRKKTDVPSVVNDLILSDKRLAAAIE